MSTPRHAGDALDRHARFKGQPISGLLKVYLAAADEIVLDKLAELVMKVASNRKAEPLHLPPAIERLADIKDLLKDFMARLKENEAVRLLGKPTQKPKSEVQTEKPIVEGEEAWNPT